MFGLSMIKLVIMGVAVASPFLGYGWGRFKGQISEYHAVAAEKKNGVERCNIRVEEIDRKHELAVVESVAAASSAAATVTETPVVPSELQALCDASPTCRSRRTK